jgi:hypothetical protein
MNERLSPEEAYRDHQAGAKKANWNNEAFRLPSPEEQPGEQPEISKKYYYVVEKLERPDD